MNSKTQSQLSILTTLARKQKIANMILLVVMVVTLIFIQTAIDAKTGFFLQGYGNCIYYVAAFVIFTAWLGLSRARPSTDKDTYDIICNGELNTYGGDPTVMKLLSNYYQVVESLGLNIADYKLKMQQDKTTNAYATGLSRGKTVCVYTQTVIDSSPSQLQSVIAHEFGHTVNKDVAFSVLRAGLGCGISLFGGILGTIVVWGFWGMNAALLFYLLTGILIPLVVGYTNRVTEYFADAFAVINGFGAGLRSDFTKCNDSLFLTLYRPFASHPSYRSRVRNINKLMSANEGKVPDSIERNFWFVIKVIAISALAVYLYMTSIPITSLIMFVLAGTLFLSADRFLSSNAGSIFSTVKLVKLDKEDPSSFQIKNIGSLLLTLLLYFGGIAACFMFLGTTSLILGILVKITVWLWCTKPLLAIIGTVSDLFATGSDLATYFGFVTAILMMASFFVLF